MISDQPHVPIGVEIIVESIAFVGVPFHSRGVLYYIPVLNRRLVFWHDMYY